MFFGFVWLVTCMAGGMLRGDIPFASTSLDGDLSDTDTTITVDSTAGFPSPSGIIVIGSERIAYSSTTDTTFRGNLARPTQRGANGTDAVAHSDEATVRMVESAIMNSSIDYDLAILADAAGAQAFLSVPTAIFDAIIAFGVSPFAFLGTDLQILTAIWGVFFLGFVVSLFLSMAGGRRV